jgi:AraC-like DNA-binding protein
VTAPVFELDYWQPDPRLAGLISGYHRYTIDPGPGRRHADVFFPGWANIRFHRSEADWRVRIGGETFVAPPAALFGPMSRAGYSDSGAGMVVGAGVTPLGWYRLTSLKARDFADRVEPLAQLLDVADDALAAAPKEDIKPRLDRLFLPLLAEPRPDEARVARIHADLMEPAPGGVAQMADRLGLSHRTLNRIALAAFGFGPKLLIRRARFLRSLIKLAETEGQAWSSRIESSYYDHSHFNRDAIEFLGMSPGEFLRLPKPMWEASARLRTELLGAPAQALLQPRLTARG